MFASTTVADLNRDLIETLEIDNLMGGHGHVGAARKESRAPSARDFPSGTMRAG